MSRIKSIIWHYIYSRFPKRIMTSQTEHGKFSYFNKDAVIGRHLYVYNSFEMDKIRAAFEILKDLGVIQKNSNTLLDIGANIGTVCIPLINEGYFKRALAFEPEPQNFSLLERNIKNNNCSSSIDVYNLGLSDKEGELFMKLSDDNYGDHRMSDIQTSGMIKVKVDRLDSVIDREDFTEDDIDLLWMDVQGHEIFVLKGAKKILNKKIPIVAEFWPSGFTNAGMDESLIINFLYDNFDYFYDLADPKLARKDREEFKNLYSTYKGETFTDLVLMKD